MADSVQEMSFQNVVDTVLKPQGIKVGGFPDELFIGLDEKDRERWQCNICYLVLHDPRKCDNGHKFCNSCVFAWSMTYGANSDKCPVCRSKQMEYSKDTQTATELSRKWVKCPEPGCALRCTLADFLQHSHGIKQYASADSNAIDNMRQNRRPPPIGALPAGAELVFLPTVNRGNVTGQGPVREGRNLLQDMLLVLHLEMELRRRAIDRFSSVAGGGERPANQNERDRHMAEVLAIQEQMQEITGFLNILFSIPPQQSQRVGGMASFPGPSNHDESSSDSDSDSNTSTIVVDSQYRQSQRGRQAASLVTGNRNTTGPSIGNTTVASLSRPLSRVVRRSEIRHELDSITSISSLSTPTHTTVVTSNTRTASNIIDVNNNPLPSPAAHNQTSTANSLSRHGQEARERLVTPHDQNEISQPVDSQSAATLPRSSSTFQSTLGQLPPIASSSAASGNIASAAPNVSSPATTATTTTATSSILSSQPASSCPGATPAPHRRPAPPATEGRAINTNRLRRRTVSSNNQTQAAASGPVNSTAAASRPDASGPSASGTAASRPAASGAAASRPAVSGPAASGSAASRPAASGPAASGAAASRLAASGAAASRPAASGPAVSGATASRPAASGPAASGPAASGPAASGPAASGPAASGPAASGTATSGTSSQQPNSNSTARHTSRQSNGNSRNSQPNRSSLPATSGALLRARRRSEIQQQIHRDMSKEDNN